MGEWDYNIRSLRLKGDDIKGYYETGWDGSLGGCLIDVIILTQMLRR